MSEHATDSQERLVDGLVHLRAKIHLAARTDLHAEFFYGDPRNEVVAFIEQQCREPAVELGILADAAAVQTDADWIMVAHLVQGLAPTLKEAVAMEKEEPLMFECLRAARAITTSALRIALPRVGGRMPEEVVHV